MKERTEIIGGIIILGLILLCIISAKVFADEKIVKIGENNVEITISHTVTDVNGVEFEVWGNPQSFGQDGIDSELISAQDELTNANNLDEVQYKKDRQDAAQETIDRLGRVQTEMNK